MTKMFGKLNSDGLEQAADRLGGGSVLETDLYTGTVKLAYAGKAASGAQSVTVMIDFGGREYREAFWLTNKAGENYYADKANPGKKQPLPGFTSVDDLCLLTTGFPLSEQTVEEKVVRIYDYEQRKEIPTNVPVLLDLVGKPISAGIVKQIVDKQKKDTSGEYRNTGETRTENAVEKFFHADSSRTVNEIRDGIETGVFAGKWVEKNKGQTRNKAKGSEGKAGVPGGGGGTGPFNSGGAGAGVGSQPRRSRSSEAEADEPSFVPPHGRHRSRQTRCHRLAGVLQHGPAHRRHADGQVYHGAGRDRLPQARRDACADRRHPAHRRARTGLCHATRRRRQCLQLRPGLRRAPHGDHRARLRGPPRDPGHLEEALQALQGQGRQPRLCRHEISGIFPALFPGQG